MNIDITNIISGFAVKKSKKPDFSFQKMIDSEVQIYFPRNITDKLYLD